MPFNFQAFGRRRKLLGFSQMDLAIVAGVHEHTVGRLERGQAPNEGGNLSIDVVARLCQALQMEYHELIIPPTGNPYEKAIRFAHQEHSSAANPKLHDRSRSIRAQGIRKMTGVRTALDQAIIDRPEGDPLEIAGVRIVADDSVPPGHVRLVDMPPPEGEPDTVPGERDAGGQPIAHQDWSFDDPSTS